MDNIGDLVYFVNSQGKRVVLSSSENRNYWELRGRTGFTAMEVDIFTEKYADGTTKYFGKALKPRNCSMKMICVGKNSAERDNLFFGMVDTLMDVWGTGEGKLYVRKTDGTLAWLNCVYSGGMNAVEQYKKFKMFTLSFYAADPFFYTKIAYTYKTGEIDDGSFTIENPTDKNLWPYMFFAQSFRLSEIPMIENLNTEKEIIFNTGWETGSYIRWFDVDIYTDPDKRGIYGIKRQNGEYYPYGPIPQMLNNSDVSQLNFPLVPGENVISYTNFYDVDTADKKSYFSYNKPLLGV